MNFFLVTFGRWTDGHTDRQKTMHKSPLRTSTRWAQKSEELNGRGPKNEAPDRRVIKIKPRTEMMMRSDHEQLS